MQTDLVCEMKGIDSTVFPSINKGDTYYFCTAACKILFDRDPEK